MGPARTVLPVTTHPPALPPLLPPREPPTGAAARVVDGALRLVHELLDDLRPELVRRAGRSSHEVKDDGTPVTSADVDVDERITATVAARFPTHGVVSEELDAVAGDAPWQWVVDPVDGTSNFAAGLPYWGVSIALCHEGVPVLGVVDAPRLGQRWHAVRGGGAHRDGVRLAVRRGVSLDDPRTAHLPFLTTLSFLRRVPDGARVRLHPRVLGAAAVDACLVADGTAVASLVSKGRVWDVAAAAVVVEEAGGVARRLGSALFPLEPGRDHTDLPSPAVFGPDGGTVDELVARLTPPDTTGPAEPSSGS